MASLTSYETGRGKRWRVRYRDAAGREHSRSFNRARDAERFKVSTESRQQLGSLYVATPVAFGAHADAWFDRWTVKKRPSPSQADSVERNLTLHLKSLRGLLIEHITASMFEDAITEIARKHPRTAQQAFETGRRVLRDARGRGQRVDEGIFALAQNRYEEREPVLLSWPEVQELAACSSEPCLIEFAALTGLRLGELAALEERDVDVTEGTVSIVRSGYRGEANQRTKTRSSVRLLELSETSRKVLVEQLLARPQGSRHVFPAEDGGQWTKRALHRRFARAIKRFGRTEMHFHDLRHTFTSLRIAAGDQPAVIAKMLGHADGGVLVMRRYGHLFGDALKQSAERFDEYLAHAAASARDRKEATGGKP